MRTLALSVVVLASLAALATAGTPHLSLSKTSFDAGDTVVLRWTGTPGNAQDWVTVVPKGTPDEKWGKWTYLKGRSEGTFEVRGLAPGSYEARLYYDWPKGGFAVVERLAFTVAVPVEKPGPVGHTGARLSVAGPRQPFGKPVEVRWQDTPGGATDWITVVPPDLADDKYGVWTYLEGKKRGTFVVKDLLPGTYEARLYYDWPDGGYAVRERVRFTVDPPAEAVDPVRSRFLSLPAAAFAKGQPVRVSWSGTPGNKQDWLTVVPAGTPEKEWGTWTYLKAQTFGVFPVVGLPPGRYEARLYFDWPAGGFTVKDRLSFEVR